MSHKHATSDGTLRYAQRFRDRIADGHFREAQGLHCSSIGLGTYLGHHDDRTDESYRAAIRKALELGCNVIDTASNYRFQRSERAVGTSINAAIFERRIARDEVVVTTKGGYLPFDGEPPRSREEVQEYIDQTFVKTGICNESDFVRGAHCMHPRFLEHQLDQTLNNLKLETVDVYYIHNPETQPPDVGRDEFYRRLKEAFVFLESAVSAGKIASYGTATWSGYRVDPESPEYLSLKRVVETAKAVAGDAHHFKVVQLPYNLSMIEAFGSPNQEVGGQQMSLLAAASQLGVTVMSSASLLQARLAKEVAPELSAVFPNLETDAQRSLQFARCAPGITTALVGMSKIEHVIENLRLSAFPPAPQEKYLELFSTT